MKKGQIQGQVFIYILTLIITAAILLYGYNAIKGLNENAEQVEFIQFKEDLEKDFKTISSDYGSVKTKTYSVPSKVKEICFHQDVDIEIDYPSDSVNINNPLILDSLRETDNNVFLVMGNVIEPMELSRIEIDDDDISLLCIPISSSRLKLRLEGRGDGVSVKQT